MCTPLPPGTSGPGESPLNEKNSLVNVWFRASSSECMPFPTRHDRVFPFSPGIHHCSSGYFYAYCVVEEAGQRKVWKIAQGHIATYFQSHSWNPNSLTPWLVPLRTMLHHPHYQSGSNQHNGCFQAQAEICLHLSLCGDST